MTAALPPETAADTVISIILARAARLGTSDLAPKSYVVLEQGGGLGSARALPSIDSVKFFLLDRATIQQLANEHGDFSYLAVPAPVVGGDTAIVNVITKTAIRPRPDGIAVILGGGACVWRLRHGETGWAVDTVLVCIIA